MKLCQLKQADEARSNTGGKKGVNCVFSDNNQTLINTHPLLPIARHLLCWHMDDIKFKISTTQTETYTYEMLLFQ